jgi:XTP/dITP diphosphohydrolase
LTRLLIATNNQGKLREYQEMLADLPYELTTLRDVGIDDEVDETGATFAENAQLKARTYAAQSGLLTLADDSGLEVAALNGAPGVYSKRFGNIADDAKRCQYLLDKLAHVPPGSRQANFRCLICIVAPDGREWLCDGRLDGEIAAAPRGTNGFGYDPALYLPELGKTVAELGMAEKNRISHRAHATECAKVILAELASE